MWCQEWLLGGCRAFKMRYKPQQNAQNTRCGKCLWLEIPVKCNCGLEPALASHYHSRRLRLRRLCRQNPRLPLSQREAQALSALSSLCLPLSQWEGGSDFTVCRRNPCLPLAQREAQILSSVSPTITAGSCPAHRNKSCRPEPQTGHLLT